LWFRASRLPMGFKSAAQEQYTAAGKSNDALVAATTFLLLPCYYLVYETCPTHPHIS
jgi:hypothetical protein